MPVIESNGSRADGPRLLLLSSEFPPGPGGIGTHAFQLARHLARMGWGVKVLAPQPYVSTEDRVTFNDRQVFMIESFSAREEGAWRSERLRAIHDAVRSFRPSLLVGTGRRALMAAAALHTIYHLPWVAVGHGSEFADHSRTTGLLMRRVLGSAQAVIAVSEYTANLIRAAARPRRLFVIPNAADGERFRAGLDVSALRRQWSIDEGKVLLTVGQVSERKAQDVVIRALPRILAAHPRLCYIIAGLPSHQAEFAALAEELGVAGRIRFTGVVPDEDLPAAYNLADLFVLVSRRAAGGDVEGYGIVVQEAALCGLPAVVSRDCGLTEAIREGETGLSVPPNEPDATADAILSLLNDDDLRRDMGRRAREAAVASTWSERIAEYDRVLRQILPPQPEISR